MCMSSRTKVVLPFDDTFRRKKAHQFSTDLTKKQVEEVHTLREREDRRRHPALKAAFGPWTGYTIFVSNKCNEPIQFNSFRKPHTDIGIVRSLDHPKVPQDNVACTYYGYTASRRARLRDESRTEAASTMEQREENEKKFGKLWDKSTLVEACCDKGSTLCSKRFCSKSRKCVRLTVEDDRRFAKGLGKGMKAICAEDAGHITLWISMDCTWRTQIRRCNTDGPRLENFIERSIELWDQFVAILPNVILMAHEVRKRQGDIVVEWPTGNALWNLPAVTRSCEDFQLRPVECNGCAMEMRGKGGGLVCKSWTLMTSSPYLWNEMNEYKCPGAKHQGLHETIEGSNTKPSSFYPQMMCDIVHYTLDQRLQNKCRRNFWPKALTHLYKRGKVPTMEDAELEGKLWNAKVGGLDVPQDIRTGAVKIAAFLKKFPKLLPHPAIYPAVMALACLDGCPPEVVVEVAAGAEEGEAPPLAPHLVVPPPWEWGEIGRIYDAWRSRDAGHARRAWLKTELHDLFRHKVESHTDDDIEHSEDGTISEAGSDTSTKSFPAKGVVPTLAEVADDDENQSCDALALVGPKLNKKGIEIFKVAPRWLVDTGCGQDLIARTYVSPYFESVLAVKPITFGTANGVTDSNGGLPITTLVSGNAPSVAHILPSTPAVLSVVERCMKRGFCYIWISRKRPCMITPALIIVPLLVKGDIPYLDIVDIERYKLATDIILFEATGVFINMEKMTVSFRLPKSKTKAPASPAVADAVAAVPVDDSQSMPPPTTFTSSGCMTDIVLTTAHLDQTSLFQSSVEPGCGVCGVHLDAPTTSHALASSKQDVEGEANGSSSSSSSSSTSDSDDEDNGLPKKHIVDDTNDDENEAKDKADDEADDTTVPTDDGINDFTDDSKSVDSEGEKDYRIDIIKDHSAAVRAKHCLLHTPAKPGCHACDLAKATNKRHVAFY